MKPLSFEEREKLSMEMLSKQRPFTLAEMREQVMRVEIRSSRGNNEQEIKYNLRIYYPTWKEEQIEVEYQRLIKAYSK